MNATWEDVCSFRALYQAFCKARRGKRGTHQELRFYADLEENLLTLSKMLKERTYTPEPLRYFTLRREDAKTRLVAEATFRDRVVHHALVAVQEQIIEPKMIVNSYACRTGKGQHAALRRAQDLCRRRRHSHALRMDVRKYFENIQHDILRVMLEGHCVDEGIQWLNTTLLKYTRVPTVPEGERRGLPIGNLTSQFWANVYLDGLDHFVVHDLGQNTYIRYMDDMVVFGSDKRVLWEVAAAVGQFAQKNLSLALKPSATQVIAISEGIPWLGMRIYRKLVRLNHSARKRLGERTCGKHECV